MNKFIIVIITGFIVFTTSGCQSFRNVFDPPPKVKDPKAEQLEAQRKANLTPHQKRQIELKKNVFRLKPKKGPRKTLMDSSLNSYEKAYLNDYYKENNPKSETRDTFKLFNIKR